MSHLSAIEVVAVKVPNSLMAAGKLVGANKVRATAYWRSASRVMGVAGMVVR